MTPQTRPTARPVHKALHRTLTVWGVDRRLFFLVVAISRAVRPAEAHTHPNHGAPMLKIRRILRDHEEAGSLNSLVALWGFVDDETFITKAGHVGVVYRLAGVDYECLDHPQRRDVVHRYEAAMRSLDESCRVYQYLIKRHVARSWDSPDGARTLARRFGIDYLIVDRELDLPLAHRAGGLYIYRLR
jgi:hypothetical protein